MVVHIQTRGWDRADAQLLSYFHTPLESLPLAFALTPPPIVLVQQIVERRGN